MPKGPYHGPPQGWKALRQRPFFWYAYDYATGHLHGAFYFRTQAVDWAWSLEIKRRVKEQYGTTSKG